jgi:dTDP-4-dehydrorhamnose reductase
MDLLVVGGSGFLGREVAHQAVRAGYQVTATFHSRASTLDAGVIWRRLDITARDEVAALVADVRPGVIINAAANREDWRTTADGAMHVAVAAAEHGAQLVHVSSDAVFSGLAVRYDESAVPDPTTPYGAAKAASETAIKAVLPSASSRGPRTSSAMRNRDTWRTCTR